MPPIYEVYCTTDGCKFNKNIYYPPGITPAINNPECPECKTFSLDLLIQKKDIDPRECVNVDAGTEPAGEVARIAKALRHGLR